MYLKSNCIAYFLLSSFCCLAFLLFIQLICYLIAELICWLASCYSAYLLFNLLANKPTYFKFGHCVAQFIFAKELPKVCHQVTEEDLSTECSRFAYHSEPFVAFLFPHVIKRACSKGYSGIRLFCFSSSEIAQTQNSPSFKSLETPKLLQLIPTSKVNFTGPIFYFIFRRYPKTCCVKE